MPPIPTSPEPTAVLPQTSSQNKSSQPADPQKEIEPSTSAGVRIPQPLPTGNRVTLKMTVDNVTLLQKALYKAGFYNGDYNGIFDEKLLEILKEFPRYVDLEPDGIVDSASGQSFNGWVKCPLGYGGGCQEMRWLHGLSGCV